MKFKVNLFPKRKQSIVDKTIYFSFHYLRYILVITQIIVIGVFFYRFKIDQELVDLKDALSQKQEIIAISQPLIEEVRAVERKVVHVNTIVSTQSKFEETFNYLLSIFPEKLQLKSLEITDNGDYILNGSTLDAPTVKLFYDRLRNDKKFLNIDLSSLRKDAFGYSFNLTLQSNPPKKK